MDLLQLCRWKFLHKETLWQSLFDLSWFLFTKMTNLLFESPFGGLRGNVRTLSIARWKVRSRLPIRDIIELFSLALTVETLWADSCRSQLFSKGWVNLSGNFRWKGTSTPTSFGIRKKNFLLPHSKYRMILSSFIWVQYQRVTDRQTDGIPVANTTLCIASNAAVL